MSSAALEQLLGKGVLWHGRTAVQSQGQLIPSGIHSLDEITGGGWPRGALTELLSPGGLGLSLLLPALVRLSREPRRLACINPPWVPYAAGLRRWGLRLDRLLLLQPLNEAESLWAAEQSLRSGACSAVLLWPSRLQSAQLRRLQLAAERGDSMAVLFLPPEGGQQGSPAALRLRFQPAGEERLLQVLKRRGGWTGPRIRIGAD